MKKNKVKDRMNSTSGMVIEEEEDLAYGAGGAGVPAGTIPTAVIQGQGKKKKNKKTSFTYNKKQFEL